MSLLSALTSKLDAILAPADPNSRHAHPPDAGLAGDYEQGVRDEREAVAAYLRRLGDYGLRDLADRIERGEHRP